VFGVPKEDMVLSSIGYGLYSVNTFFGIYGDIVSFFNILIGKNE
jgi:hypothetical protein